MGQGGAALTKEGLKVARKGVLVTAFGANPDGRGTLLRVWEMAGEKGRCEISLPAGFAMKYAQPVNLRGVPQGKSIAVENGRFSFICGPSPRQVSNSLNEIPV